MMDTGLFIVLEGIDGTGKTTQARMLKERLQEQGIPATTTREPGGTVLGENIRQILLSPEQSICAWTEILLYAAARRQLVEEVILPALHSGQVVICDRFVLSSLAYQGYGRGEDPKKILELNHQATGGLWPDLTVVLDMEVDRALERLEKNSSLPVKDRFESMDAVFYQQVREGYLVFAQKYSSDIRLIPGDSTPEIVHTRIWLQMEGLL